MSGRPAIFLDRDGTLNEQVGFVDHPSRLRLYPWTAAAVRWINEEDYLAIVVSNQSGVSRGLFTEETIEEVHRRIREHLAGSGARLDAIYYCPHWPPASACECRKPKTGMLTRARDELGVDLSRSYVVSDTYPDLQMAWAAGCRAALVLTGYGRGAHERILKESARPPDLVAPNLFLALAEIFWESTP